MFMLNLFKAKMAERELCVKEVATALGINEATLYRKMRGETEFTRNEIQHIRNIMQMTPAEVDAIFFA